MMGIAGSLWFRHALAATALLSSMSAGAQPLYRCSSPDGRTTYTDRPCELSQAAPIGSRQSEVKIVDNATDSEELRRESGRARAEADLGSSGAMAQEPGDAPRLAGNLGGDDCTNAKKKAANAVAPSVAKHYQLLRAVNKACDRPLPQPRNQREARAVVDEKIRRARRDLELNQAAQADYARQHFGGARVLGCDGSGCNTTAGRLEGGRGLMFGPAGTTCSTSAGGIVSCR